MFLRAHLRFADMTAFWRLIATLFHVTHPIDAFSYILRKRRLKWSSLWHLRYAILRPLPVANRHEFGPDHNRGG
jgi:hypothetical protein